MYRVNSNIIFCEEEGVLTLCNLNSGEFYEIADVGLIIWNSICKTTEEIIEEINNKYGNQNTDDVRKDVENFVKDLLDTNLIEHTNGNK